MATENNHVPNAPKTIDSSVQYIELFQQNLSAISAKSAGVMNAVREQAFAHFKELGIPKKKDERYRYTDMQAMFKPDYGLNINRIPIAVNPKEVYSCAVPGLSTALYFVINDAFHAQSAVSNTLPQGVVVDSLCSFAQKNPELVAKHYAQLAQTQSDGITALNTMLAQDGLIIYVPKNVKVDKTIQVINVMSADVDLMMNRRVLIILEQGAEAKVLFCDHTVDSRNFLSTQVVEAYVGENASLDLYCLEETGYANKRVSNVYFSQASNSKLNHNVLTLHNGITRNHAVVTFKGEGADCKLCGCVIADKHQHTDNNTIIDHAVPHCTSNELYKYVLDGNSVGAFTGRILVQKDAQKTFSEERNQNICVSKQARMYSQPELEIYADDVKCAHGSTVGQLNDTALLYMRQRGISEKEAKMLLEVAFINEVIDEISLEPLREPLHQLVEKRFKGELGNCGRCEMCK